jgi:putative NADPH-quinone reductase
MKIALINGSPKGTASASALVLEELKGLLGGIELTELSIRSSRVETLESLGNHDVIVFSFPTYVDGIPSHLLRALVQLEDHWRERAPRLGLTVYVIAN